MKKLSLFLTVILILILPGWAQGATYYVDATNGLDSNNGLSTGSAWKTISKINAMTFNPGDSILFKRGDIWREQLTVSSSGSAENPITFGAYGTGEKPKITGADMAEDWIGPDANGEYYNWELMFGNKQVLKFIEMDRNVLKFVVVLKM